MWNSFFLVRNFLSAECKCGFDARRFSSKNKEKVENLCRRKVSAICWGWWIVDFHFIWFLSHSTLTLDWSSKFGCFLLSRLIYRTRECEISDHSQCVMWISALPSTYWVSIRNHFWHIIKCTYNIGNAEVHNCRNHVFVTDWLNLHLIRGHFHYLHTHSTYPRGVQIQL